MFIWSENFNIVVYVATGSDGYGNTTTLCVWMVVPSDDC